MSWWQWKSLVDAQRQWERQYYALPPDACPYDGTPLDIGQQTDSPGGGKLMVRHCPLGNYVWYGGTRIT